MALLDRLAAAREAKQQAAQPNIVVVPNQQPQPQLAAQAVQPAGAGQPGFTNLGAGVNVATSTPLSLSNPIEVYTPTFRKDTSGVLGGGGGGGLLGGILGRRRLLQQVVTIPAGGGTGSGWWVPGWKLLSCCFGGCPRLHALWQVCTCCSVWQPYIPAMDKDWSLACPL